MSFTEAVRSAGMRNYANFQGRALRSEFWYFMLAFTLASVVTAIIDEVAIGGYSVLETIVTLAAVLPPSLSGPGGCTISTARAGGRCCRSCR
jgi:uncharacterized membrane protein YhaH (DUF805 family)